MVVRTQPLTNAAYGNDTRNRRVSDPRPPRVGRSPPSALRRGARRLAHILPATACVGGRQRPGIHRPSVPAAARRTRVGLDGRTGAPSPSPLDVVVATDLA